MKPAAVDRMRQVTLWGTAVSFVALAYATWLPTPWGDAPSFVGPTIAAAVASFFQEPANLRLLDRLAAAGLTLTEPTAVAGDAPPAGKSFVLTGTLPNLSRSEAAAAGGDTVENRKG